jgi:catalase
MIDPFTAFAAVKSAVSAGKELVNVTKQIGEFFDGVDDLRAAHERKKSSLFSGSDENAMETFVNLQRAKDAEEELRQIVIATRGFSAWGELQAIRVQARKDRKAKALAEKKRKQKMMERFIIYGGSIAIVAIMLGMTVVIILAKQGRI